MTETSGKYTHLTTFGVVLLMMRSRCTLKIVLKSSEM